MKTPKTPTTSKRGRPAHVQFLALAAVLIVPAATVFGQNFYTNNGTGDFNVASYWKNAIVPVGNACNDNGSNNVVLIQPGDPVWQHGDTLAGQTAGASGAYLQTGSTNNTGYPSGGNWMRLGIGTGSAGYYTLSNGVVNVAQQTHIGENGTATLEVDGGAYNTGYSGNPGICAGDGDFGPSTGTLILTGGAITNISNETWFGEANSACTGYLIMSGGTFSVNNWFVFGRNGGNGFGTMTGGTINFRGGGNFLVGGGGVGSLAQSGGTINAFNQYLIPQSNGGGTGRGTNILSGTAVLNDHDWLALGRNSGYGELDVSGNAAITVDRTGGANSNSHFDIGAGGKGVLNQNGGFITNTAADLWLGESASGTWNLNSGTAVLANVVMCVNSGSPSAVLNLSGGLFQCSGITSVNSATTVSLLNLNGGTLQANANNTTFISGLFQASVGPGSVIDSQGFSITIPQALLDNGGGSITKNGTGTLTLTGANTYSGATIVNQGTLATTTASTGGGDCMVTNGTTLSVQVAGSLNSQLNLASLTLASPATTLNIDLNNFGNPASAPLNVVGALTVNGTATITIADSLPQIGQFPLIKYGSKSGSSYVLGSLPVGVVGNLVDNTVNQSIDLNITSINLPRWEGNAGGNWDLGLTTNWINIGTGLPTTYGQGNAVVFDDNATGVTNVNLVTTVNPSIVTFNNSVLNYTLTGSGKISGSVGLNQLGTGTVSILNTGGNNFSGPVVVTGGTLSVTNLANGGSASAIGASSSSPTNLVLVSGTLSYGGPAVSINRGYSIQNTNNTIDAEGNLTLSGLVTATSTADFIKTGPAQLTYTTAGINALSASGSAGYRTIQGTTKFDGSSGGQTNNILGHFGVGGLGGTNAAVILTNTTLNVTTGGIDLGRSGGATGTLSVNSGAVLNATSGNFALGDGGGVVSTGVVNQAGGTVNVSGPQMFVGQNIAGVGSYNLSGGTLNINNWLAVGRQGGAGTFNLSGSGVLIKTGGGNVDIGTSAGVGGFTGTGTLNQTGGVITNTASQTWLGEGFTGEPAAGTWNMSAGTAQLGELHVGQGGTGTNTINISGTGAINCAGYVDLALDATIGNVNIGSAGQPGGSLTAQGDLTVADLGTATLNMVTNGSGLLTVQGTLYLSRGSATANGSVNLNTGSTIVASYVNNGWGFGHGLTNNPQSFNFNGGTLKSYTNANPAFPFFQPFVNAVVQSGGAIIDDGGLVRFVEAALVDGGGGGGLTKLGSGTLYLDGNNTYTGSTLVNAGTLGGLGTITGPVTVAAGATLVAGNGAIGTLTINNTLTFAAGSTNMMKLASANNDHVVGLTGVAYNGALVVTNTSGAPLTAGSGYQLFNSAVAGSGNFSSVTILPAGTGTFNPTTGILTITSAGGGVTFNPVKLSGGNLIMTGTGGAASTGYTLLTTTNLTTPQAAWLTNTTGTFDSSGNFSNAVPVNIAVPAQFFLIRTP